MGKKRRRGIPLRNSSITAISSSVCESHYVSFLGLVVVSLTMLTAFPNVQIVVKSRIRSKV
jgi:hypothetical protein